MEAEAQPLVEHLNLSKDEPSKIPPPAPAITFSGEVNGASVHVVSNGKFSPELGTFAATAFPSFCSKPSLKNVS